MTRSIRLLQFTDTHLLADPHGRLRGVEPLATLERVLDHAAGAIRNSDALLATGDIVNDDAGGYTHFQRVLFALDKPVLCLPGNHDDQDAMRRTLASAPFQVGGFVDYGPWRVVLIDSCKPGDAGGRVSRQELDALDSALAGAAGHALVCMHHHPIPMGSRWLDTVGIENPEELFEVLESHSQVRGLCWGHVHQSFDTRQRGIRLLGTPSTCVQFLPLSAQFAIDGRPPAYRRLTLSADGRIDTEVVWVFEAADKVDLPNGATGGGR